MLTQREHLLSTLNKLKKCIVAAEKRAHRITEMETRQSLINPLFRVLGWDFYDLEVVRAEFRCKRFNEPVDFAMFIKGKSTKPILLVEAKALGTDLNRPQPVKQLCTYLGELGVQWGVLTDGNKYVMYNNNAGAAFDDKKFLAMQIKTADTDDGIPMIELASKLESLLSYRCLDDNRIQKYFESHVIDSHIERALWSLLTAPFATLVAAIRKEFKEERVKKRAQQVKITPKHIASYLDSLKDDEGRICFFSDPSTSSSDEDLLKNVALAQQEGTDVKNVAQRTKRITISNLLSDGLVHEGDSWRLEYKGEIYWGRITGNGEIDIKGKTYTSPSKAGRVITGKNIAGWNAWHFKHRDGRWQNIDQLRREFRHRHNLEAITRQRNYNLTQRQPRRVTRIG